MGNIGSVTAGWQIKQTSSFWGWGHVRSHCTTKAWLTKLSHQIFLCQILKDSPAKVESQVLVMVKSWRNNAVPQLSSWVDTVSHWIPLMWENWNIQRVQLQVSSGKYDLETCSLAINPGYYNFLNSDIIGKEMPLASAGKMLFPRYRCRIDAKSIHTDLWIGSFWILFCSPLSSILCNSHVFCSQQLSWKSPRLMDTVAFLPDRQFKIMHKTFFFPPPETSELEWLWIQKRNWFRLQNMFTISLAP